MQQPTIASWLITTAHKLHTLFVDCSAASRWSQYPRMYCSQSRSRYLELSAPQFQQVQGGARHELNRLIILLCRTFMKAIRRCQQSGSFGALAAHVGHVGLSLSLVFSLHRDFIPFNSSLKIFCQLLPGLPGYCLVHIRVKRTK